MSALFVSWIFATNSDKAATRSEEADAVVVSLPRREPELLGAALRMVAGYAFPLSVARRKSRGFSKECWGALMAGSRAANGATIDSMQKRLKTALAEQLIVDNLIIN
jgi:hypothetical protein